MGAHGDGMVMRPDGSATPPRPSASVLVVGAGQPWRVLMMRRPRGAEFAPNAYVFPGGTVHTAEDGGFDDEIRAAAVRELFEEMGVLLARRSDGRFAADRECLGLAAALDAGRGWADALAQARLAPAFDRLVPLTRWITPEGFPRRYDTRFFVARNPAAQTVRPRPGEVAEWCWASPREVLESPSMEIVYPTRRILESVAGEPDSARLIARLRRRRADLDPVEPRLVRGADGSLEIVL